MKVYIVQYPNPNGSVGVELYTEAAAIRAARASRAPHEDTRTDAEALDDFIVVHWPTSSELIE